MGQRKEEVKQGASAFIARMFETHFKVLKSKDITLFQKAMRIIQINPELAYSTFLKGATSAQLHNMPSNKRLAFRMGQRKEEVKIWGSYFLKHIYDNTLNVVYCKRRIEIENEYIGKSHLMYVNSDMSTFWTPLRAYENSLYRYYSKNSLRNHNELRIVGIFSLQDEKPIRRFLKNYDVPVWKPDKSLLKLIHKKTIQKNIKKSTHRKKNKKFPDKIKLCQKNKKK